MKRDELFGILILIGSWLGAILWLKDGMASLIGAAVGFYLLHKAEKKP